MWKRIPWKELGNAIGVLTLLAGLHEVDCVLRPDTWRWRGNADGPRP